MSSRCLGVLRLMWEFGLSLIVNTNVSSLAVRSSLAGASNELQSAMERLSSGQRINNAADDAAGFAIAERMTAQVRGLNMAIKNANDAKSLLDKAQAMYADQTDLIQRVRELAVQALNDTNSQSDREFLQSEVDSLVAEVHRIGTEITFNGQSVGGTKSFQLGSAAGQSLDVYVPTVSSLTGSIYGQLTQDYPAGSTVLEVKGLTKTGPFAFADIVYAGLDASLGSFVVHAGDAEMHEDGTFTQIISLATGTEFDLEKDSHIVAAVGTVDLNAPPESNFTLGGRHSLLRVDLVNDVEGALLGIDASLEQAANYRADLGAIQNRLDYTVSNLMNVSENTVAARSRIEDADFATESANLAKAQALQQAGIAMLAQANASPQLVLSLVR